MEQQKYIAGLDVGSSYITLAVRVCDADNKWGEQVHYARVPSRGVQSNIVSNAEEVRKTISKVVDAMKEKLGFRVKRVHLAFIGGSVECSSYEASLRCETKQQGTNYTIISKEDYLQIEKETIKFSMPNTETIFDKEALCYLANGEPISSDIVGAYADEFTCRYNLFIANKEYVNRLMYAVKNSGLEVVRLFLNVRASGAALLTEEQCRVGVAVLNVGLDRSELAYYENGCIQHYAWIAIGGNQITVDLMAAFKIWQERAEDRKRGETNLFVENSASMELESLLGVDKNSEVDALTLENVVRSRLYELAEKVANQFKAWRVTTQLSNSSGLVITGGGIVLSGCDSFLQAAFRLKLINIPVKVRYGVPVLYEPLPCKDEMKTESAMQLTTALGLVRLAEKNNEVTPVAPDAAPEPAASVQATNASPSKDTPASSTKESFIGRVGNAISRIASSFLGDAEDPTFDDKKSK